LNIPILRYLPEGPVDFMIDSMAVNGYLFT